MINTTIVNKICVAQKMTKLSISINPTWMDNLRMEGIEIIQGNIQTFWNKGGERVYGEPYGDKIQKILELIKVEEIGSTTIHKEPENNNAIIPSTINNMWELPDFLTEALFEKWAKKTTTQRVMMFQQTPKEKIKYVTVGKRDGKDIVAPYVEGNYMVKEANAAFLFDWYLSDVVISCCTTGVSVSGKLYGYFSDKEKYLVRPATGYQELNKAVDMELAKKGATTDAIKKGLSLFGFNSDVYGGERD